jgi:hypothetical protein
MSPGTGPGDRLVAAALAGGAVASPGAEIVPAGREPIGWP